MRITDTVRTGQDQMVQPAPEILRQGHVARGGEKPEGWIGEGDQHQGGGDELGQRHADIGREADAEICRAATPQRRQDAERDCDEEHQSDGQEGQEERAPQGRKHHLRDWKTCAQRRAKVTLQDAREPAPILHDDGSIEPEALAHSGELDVRGVLAQQHHGRIARQHLGDAEDDERHDEEGEEDRGDPLQEIAAGHGRSSTAASAPLRRPCR
jgi:hypothetical protein